VVSELVNPSDIIPTEQLNSAKISQEVDKAFVDTNQPDETLINLEGLILNTYDQSDLS